MTKCGQVTDPRTGAASQGEMGRGDLQLPGIASPRPPPRPALTRHVTASVPVTRGQCLDTGGDLGAGDTDPCHSTYSGHPLPTVAAACVVELQTKVHTKVRNHGEGPYILQGPSTR